MVVRTPQAAADRSGGARLHRRLGVEGLQATGAICGIALPAGLREAEKLPAADLHAGDQGARRRARREHFVRGSGTS